MSKSKFILPACLAVLAVALYAFTGEGKSAGAGGAGNSRGPDSMEKATFGAGCFWCVEAVFEQLKGVVDVKSGYAGGAVPNPTYEQVCTGQTGHAEVCQIYYDPAKISFPELLEVFWKTHDPTTLNRQGPDEGTQYRSAVFYHTPEQKQLAEKYKAELNAEGAFERPIVTEKVFPEFTLFDQIFSLAICGG